MLSPAAIVELCPEKPVAGGRMLARVAGEVVLVAGAIPGERVSVRLDRRQQGVWFANVVDVLEPSADRRDPGPDPACGGMGFAHIAYPRQCELKSALVQDAMTRIAKVLDTGAIALTPSPTEGYRMRYRVHAGGGRLGFYREGTHDVCDPAASGQLARASVAAIEALAGVLPPDIGKRIEAFELIENLANTERAVNLALREAVIPPAAFVDRLGAVPGITGVSMTEPRPARVIPLAGRAWVSDSVAVLIEEGVAPDLEPSVHGVPAARPLIRRHAPSFFQANRFLTPILAARVRTLVADGPVIDLYAGVGLFGVTLAADGRSAITAIESDEISADDLGANAKPFEGTLTVVRSTVESYLRRAGKLSSSTLIVDPPRTGMSRLAMQGILAADAARLVYVSCDIATLARDTRRLLDAGYRLQHLEALDLFPNTAHVEAIAVFNR